MHNATLVTPAHVVPCAAEYFNGDDKPPWNCKNPDTRPRLEPERPRPRKKEEFRRIVYVHVTPCRRGKWGPLRRSHTLIGPPIRGKRQSGLSRSRLCAFFDFRWTTSELIKTLFTMHRSSCRYYYIFRDEYRCNYGFF